MEPTLKSCPFCGSKSSYIKRYRQDIFLVRCDYCLAQSDELRSQQLAADDWNSRNTPGLTILLKAIQEEIKKTGGNAKLEEALDRAGLQRIES